MTAILQQVALAIGAGASIAIAGQGIVQIYRGSGVLNFAHGGFALASAETFVWLWDRHGVPLLPAIAAAVGLGALLGVLTQLLVMRPLRDASQLVRIVATIGVLQVVQQGTLLLFGTDQSPVGSFLPSGSVELGSINVQQSALTVLVIALALTGTLWFVMRRTTFGRVTQAVAESQVVARSLGRSPEAVATANWALGGGLAALAGVLVVPIGGLAVSSILLMAVPAFAAAVLGGFRSYVLTTAGAIAIAAGQSVYTFESVRRDWPPGVAPALPFLVVAVALTCRTGALPRRDEVIARLPKVARTLPRPVPTAVGAAAALGVTLLASDALANALITTFVAAIVGLSLVVVTGLSGQISLAQFAVAGLGALVAAKTSDAWGWPFVASLVVGTVAAALSGLLFGLPALRTRGPALAVATIGLGLAVQQGVLADGDITGGFNGATPVKRPTLAGFDIDAVDHPQRYAAVAAVAFGALALAISVLRASAVGRRLLAVRNNERAAAALGVSVAAMKLYAFVVGAAIAGVGGVLLAFRYDTVQYGRFGFFDSLSVLTVVLIGGVGYVLGPLVGALGLPGGVISYLTDGIGDLSRWLVLGGGALLVLTLIRFPDGMAALAAGQRRRRQGLPQPVAAASLPSLPTDARVALDVKSLRVAFGGVTVLDGVHLRVEPGSVLGLIGANGAGKTTLIDTVSGYNRPAGGTVLLGGDDVTGRHATTLARRGMGRCFQSLELFEDLTVAENLLVAVDVVRPRHWVTSLVWTTTTSLPADAAAVAVDLGLGDLLDRLPGELSHGQRRLVGVARALVARPSVLLLDEPAAGLDAEERDHLAHVIRAVAGRGVGVLLVDHDVDLVVRVSDHVLAIDFGAPIYDGPPAGVADNPAVRAAYLGADDDVVEEVPA